MRLSSRSYPHPVVGNQDDVVGAAFQSTVEMTADKANVYLSVSTNCSSSTLNKLIKKGDAQIILHVECSNTLFRKTFPLAESETRVVIQADDLSESVEVNTFVCAKKDISGYRIEKSHEDYGDAAFDLKAGDILAIAEGHIFPIENNFDSMSRIGSIMHIVKSTENGDVPMKVEFSSDKIQIILSQQDFKDYILLKNSEIGSGPLTTAIVLPVLVEALSEMGTEDPEDDSRKWVRVLNRKVKDLGLEDESDRLIKAQKILELPVKRSLAASRTLVENGF